MFKVEFKRFPNVVVKDIIVIVLLNHYHIAAAPALKTGSFSVSNEEKAYEIAGKLRACGLYVEVN